jgi:hypothetical protein
VATTQGTLTLLNATLTLHPGTSYAPTQTLAVVAAFGGGVVNVENSIIDIPTTLGYGLQVMNTDPGGGLPGQAGSFAQINAANTIVRIGSGITGTGRTFGGFVAGESELNVTNGTFELGDYSTGIYNIFSTTYASPVLGSRTNLTDTSLTLGNRSVGWWGTGARAPARLSDTRGRFLVGEQSWGLYMTTGSFATLTDTQVQTGSNSYGAALVQGAELTLAGQAAITAAGTGSIGIDSNASRVFFNPGSLKVLGGKQGIVGSNAANFLLRSGGTLGVQGQSGEGAIYLDTGSQFTSEASSALNVSSPTGGGIFALGSQALLAGTVNVSAGRSAVYVRDSLGHVALSGGGTLASTNEDTEGVIAAEATGLFEGSGLTISGIGVENSWGAVGRNGGEVRLASSTVKTVGTTSYAVVAQGGTGTGLWLHVGNIENFELLDAVVPDLPPDLPPDDPSTPLPTATASAVFALPAAQTPTVADITATRSTLNGAALTDPGAAANLLLQDSLWNMSGSSNLTTLQNTRSRILFAPPAGDPSVAAGYRTLTVSGYGGDGTLVLNTWLAADDSPSDQLVVSGGASSGPGQLEIHASGGLGDLTRADGIRVVQAFVRQARRTISAWQRRWLPDPTNTSCTAVALRPTAARTWRTAGSCARSSTAPHRARPSRHAPPICRPSRRRRLRHRCHPCLPCRRHRIRRHRQHRRRPHRPRRTRIRGCLPPTGRKCP